MNDILIRSLCAFFVGLLSSQAGSITQFLTRNKLASPSTLGFDGVSVLIVIMFSLISSLTTLSWPREVLLPVGFFLLFLISYFYSKIPFRAEGAVLLGLSINLFSGAFFSFLQFLFYANHLTFPSEIWFGHFKFADINSLLPLVCLELFFLISFFIFYRKLQLMSLSRPRESKINLFMYFFAASITFLIIFYFGTFAFLGLLFPILSRFLFFQRYDFKGEFVYGALLNGVIVWLIDWVGYSNPIQGAELPVGLFLSLLGSLTLIFILVRQQALRNIGKKSK